MNVQHVSYMMFFGANGLGPWPCHFCGEDVSYTWTDERRDLHVHHVDGNRQNNDPGNLVASHARCHRSHHSKERWKVLGEKGWRPALADATPEQRRAYAKKAWETRRRNAAKAEQ